MASHDVTAAEPEAEGATPAESSSHSIAESSKSDSPASADQEDQSSIAAAISSATDTVYTKTSDAVESLAESTGTARQSVTDAAETVASAAGLGFAQKNQDLRTRGSDGVGSTGASSEPTKTVYVGNIYFDVTEEDLRKEMERFGTVLNVKIIYDGRGLSKG